MRQPIGTIPLHPVRVHLMIPFRSEGD